MTSKPVQSGSVDSSLYFLVYDNRLQAAGNFALEAQLFSYHQHVQEFILRLLSQCHFLDWLPYPSGIVIASSPSTMQVLNPAIKPLSALLQDIQPRYSVLGGSVGASTGWRDFYTHAIREIIRQVTGLSRNKRVFIFLYAPELSLFGDPGSSSIQESVNSFLLAFIQLLGICPKATLRIVSTSLGGMGGGGGAGSGVSEGNRFLFYQTIQSFVAFAPYTRNPTLTSVVTLDTLLNTPYSFSEEVQVVAGRLAPYIHYKLFICTIQNMDIHLDVGVYATVCMGGLGVRRYAAYRELEVCSVLGRGGINPSHISGVNFHVQPWMKASCDESSEAPGGGAADGLQDISNAAIFIALTEELANRHLVLLFRSLRDFGEGGGGHPTTPPLPVVYDYWALIPPLPSAVQASSPNSSSSMVLCQLYSHDDLLLPSPPPLPHPQSLDTVDSAIVDAREQVGVCLDGLAGECTGELGEGGGGGGVYEPLSFHTGRWDYQVGEMLRGGRGGTLQARGGYVHHSPSTPAPASSPGAPPVPSPSSIPQSPANPNTLYTPPVQPQQVSSGAGRGAGRGGRGRGRGGQQQGGAVQGGFQTASSMIDQQGVSMNQPALSLQPKAGSSGGRGGGRGGAAGGTKTVTPPPARQAPSQRPHSPPLEDRPSEAPPSHHAAPATSASSRPESPKMFVGRLLRRKVGGRGWVSKAPTLSWNDSDEELVV